MTTKFLLLVRRLAVLFGALGAAAISPAPGRVFAADLADELKTVPFKIVYESWQKGNWELMMVNADGSHPVNLTKTPDVNEHYPHVSPDGKRVLFEVDAGEGDATIRSIWMMNLDGTGRTRIAEYGRDACWNGDGTAIAYLPDESKKRFQYMDYATKGVMIYDLKTHQCRPHPNKELYHLYNICWAPDGRWFVSTVHAGMGFGHAILAFPADDAKVFNLKIPGCRPDLSPDGKKITWGCSDYALGVADLDLSGPVPKLTHRREVATCVHPMKIYHADWSPDGRYIAFALGPTEKKLGRACEIVGVKAPGWNIGVADANGKDRKLLITHDGASDKEPDWAPVAAR